MSLRIKTLIMMAVLILGIFAVMYILSQTVLLTSFEQLETLDIRQNVERVLNAIDDSLNQMSSTNRDYSRWDDAYTFVENSNQAFVDDNLYNDTFINLDLNLMIFVNSNGKIVFSKAVDLTTGSATALPTTIEDYLKPASTLLKHADNDSSASGIISVPEGILLLTSRPIVDSLGVQPARGSLIFGRFLDERQTEVLSANLRLPITLRRMDGKLEADFAAASTALTDKVPVFTQPLNETTISGYAPLSDIDGHPAILIRVDQPRDTYAQGQSTISFFFLLLLLSGGLFLAITLLSIERFFLSPLSRLTRNVNRIASSGDPAERLTITGSDELASLGNDINKMLGQLEGSQVALHEQDVRLRTVVKSSPIMLWAVDREERFTLAEGRGLSSLGIDPQNALGKKASEVFVNVPHLLEDIRRTAKGESFGSVVPMGERTFDMRYTPITDAEGEITGVIGVATDVTERMKAEQKLNTTYNDLTIQNQRLRRVSELLRSTVSVMTETVKRGAPKDELLDYMSFVNNEMSELN